MTAAILKAFGQVCQALYAAQPLWDVLLFAGVLAAVPLVLTGAVRPSHPSRDPGASSDDIPSHRISAVPPGEPAMPGDRPARLDWTLVVLLALLGAVLRLYGRDALPYWWDELLAVWLSRSGPEVMLASLFTPSAPASDFSPPLFYSLLAGWTRLFGQEEATTRVLTALFSAAAVPVAYCAGRELMSRRTGLLAALLLAVSPLAVFYAQQVRCYSLLGLLGLLALVFANRAWRTGTRRDLACLGLIGVLFLFTHFVAAWAWFGLGVATALRLVLRRLRAPGSPPFRFAVGAAWPAGLALCALCPLYWPPALETPDAPAILAVAGLAAALLSCTRLGRPEPGRAGFWPLLAAFLLPALAIAAWILPSGVIGVIGGSSAYVPGSYGQAEFSRLLTAFCGLQSDSLRAPVQLCLFLLAAGLFAFSQSRPGECLLLLGWAGLPLAMAMLAQNSNMNLTRYLFFSLPAFLLLMAAAVDTGVGALLALPAWLARRSPGTGRLRRVLALACGLVLAAGVFGYRAYTAMPFPTMRADFEDYPGAAAHLAKESRFLLTAQSHNLVRALSWYMARGGAHAVSIQADSPALFALNTYMDGRPWSPDLLAKAQAEHAVLAGRFGEVALFAAPPAPTGRPPLEAAGDATGTSFTLSGDALRRNLDHGRDVAVAGGAGLVPLFKDRPGFASYRVDVPAAPGQVLVLRPQGLVLGAMSAVTVTVAQDGQNPWEARVRLGRAGALQGELRRTDAPDSVPAVPDGPGLRLALPDSQEPTRRLRVDIHLYDDNSGAIYSSNAALSGLEARFERASR